MKWKNTLMAYVEDIKSRGFWDWIKDAYYKMDKEQLLYSRAEVNRFNIIVRLGEIKAPTLVLIGDGFGEFAINMAKKTANMRYLILLEQQRRNCESQKPEKHLQRFKKMQRKF